MSFRRLVVFIVGPTAVGKSELALSAAEKKNAAIVNADSVQVYQRLDIGTAKPSPSEQARVPHFLFDFVPPGKRCTAGEYRQAALEVLNEQAFTQPLFFVGGSGFYLRALEKGMYEVKDVPGEVIVKWRQRAQVEGTAALYKELQAKDPAYAAQLSANDQYRILRALSLMDVQPLTMTQLKEQFSRQDAGLSPNAKVGLWMPREELRLRVAARVEKMVHAGLAEEVEQLLREGLEDWPALQSVGYKETIRYLKGAYDAEEWREEIIKNTMRLAKKQMTWFRRDTEIRWFKMPEESASALAFLDSLQSE